MNNMLIGVITSTLSSWGIKIRHPPMSNILVGVITSTLFSWPPEVRRGAAAGLQRTCLKTNPHEDPCRPNVSVLRNCVTVHWWGSRISKSAVFDGLFELMPHALWCWFIFRSVAVFLSKIAKGVAIHWLIKMFIPRSANTALEKKLPVCHCKLHPQLLNPIVVCCWNILLDWLAP